MNNKGKGSGLALIVILIVAIIIALLFIRQMGASRPAEQDKKQQIEIVNQTRQAVDAINQKIEESPGERSGSPFSAKFMKSPFRTSLLSPKCESCFLMSCLLPFL